MGVFKVHFTLIIEDRGGHVNYTFCWSKLSKYLPSLKSRSDGNTQLQITEAAVSLGLKSDCSRGLKLEVPPRRLGSTFCNFYPTTNALATAHTSSSEEAS